MMTFVKKQVVEINEKRLAKDLSDLLYDALDYQDRDFADDIAEGNYEFERLAMLNRISEIWHEEYLQYIDNSTASDKEFR